MSLHGVGTLCRSRFLLRPFGNGDQVFRIEDTAGRDLTLSATEIDLGDVNLLSHGCPASAAR